MCFLHLLFYLIKLDTEGAYGILLSYYEFCEKLLIEIYNFLQAKVSFHAYFSHLLSDAVPVQCTLSAYSADESHDIRKYWRT